MTEMDKILAGLLRRTEDGSLKWDAAERDDEFAVSVDAISVTLRRLESDEFTIQDRHRLVIRNDAGSTVESLETTDEFGFVPRDRRATDEQAGHLYRLFILARRSALNTQATLEKLAKALEA